MISYGITVVVYLVEKRSCLYNFESLPCTFVICTFDEKRISDGSACIAARAGRSRFVICELNLSDIIFSLVNEIIIV